jgi:anti-anti-sigma regulatory factor
MLKITTRTDEGTTVFELEGRLAGPWVEEFATCWRQASADSRRRVKLNAVTFIDAAGRKLLAEMYRQGIKLEATGCMTRSIVDEIMRGEKL